MQTLYTELCNIIEDREDLNFSKVAKYIDASKQCMSNFKKKGVIGFRKLLRLSYLLFPDNQKETMADWCLRVNSSESIKHSFEYAAITRNIELLGNLITKYEKEKGVVGEYVAIYTVLYNYITDKISGYDLIDNLKRVGNVGDEPLKVLVEIMKCYNYFFQKNFPLMVATAREAENMLQSLSDERELFFKECYLHRIAEVLDHAYLFMNNVKLARHYAFIIINADICPKTVSDASYIVGMSYLVEDKQKCLEYLQKSYDIAKTIGDISIEKESRLNLDFAKLYLDEKLDSDSHVALLNYQENRFSEVNLNLIKEVMYQEGDEDFICFFEAVFSGSIQNLYKCFMKFHADSNFFFASVVAKELRKNGDDSEMTKIMMSVTIKVEESVYFEKDFINSFSNFNSSSSRGICA